MGAAYLDRSKVEAAYVVFSTVFDMKLKAAPVVYPEIATVIPGVSEKLEFKWLGSIPTMKKWLGDRTITRLRGETHTLTTEWWANGIEIDVDDFNNDAKLGLLAKRVGTLAKAAVRRIDEQVCTYYINGFAGTSGLTYDGQFLFDTDHTASGSGGTAQNNLLTGAFASASLNTGIQRAMLFVDDQGEPIDVRPAKVLAGPQNQLAIRQVLKAEFQAGGATNIDASLNFGALIAPRITGTHWFMLADEELMPVIVGIEVEPQFAAADDPKSPEMFMRRNALYGGHTKFGTIYGFWQGAMGSTG